jgi:hypothetical protein
VPEVPSSAALTRSTIVWMPGAAPSLVGNASTSEVSPRCCGADDAGQVSELRGDLLRVAAVLDEDVEWLHHAGADARVGEHLSAGDRGSRAGEVLQLGLSSI